VSNPLRTHVKNFLLYKFWEIGPSFINKYTVSVSIYERLAGVTSKLAQNEYTGPANYRYPTVRLGAPAKLKKLHSKIGRRVDLARVRYGTMQSERRRY
jgi:hypothetical protein